MRQLIEIYTAYSSNWDGTRRPAEEVIYADDVEIVAVD